MAKYIFTKEERKQRAEKERTRKADLKASGIVSVTVTVPLTEKQTLQEFARSLTLRFLEKENFKNG